MGQEVKSKKRKAAAPHDEVAKVKKIKQIVSDVLLQKRKVANDPSTTSAKKSKGPKPNTLKDVQSFLMTKDSPIKIKGETGEVSDVSVEKLKSSGNLKAMKEKLSEAQYSIDLSGRESEVKKPAMTKIVPDDDDDDDSEGEEIADQTRALLKGFESDDDSEKDPDDQGYVVGDTIPKVSKRKRRMTQEAVESPLSSGNSGVVYIGRIPHGFYEQEMRQYFSQFGNITNLRLSRNRKTGKSKHFAFVEFELAEVAEIVSKTMDNYLLFGHILKCKLVAPEQVHKDLWIGANKRFKSVPWNKIHGRKLSQAKGASEWERKMVKEEKRRADKKAAMKVIDYEFESPKLKSAADLLKEKKQVLIEPANAEPENKLDEEVSNTTMAPEKDEGQTVTAISQQDKKETETDTGIITATTGLAERMQALPTVVAEPSEKKRKKNKEAKTSNKIVGADELNKPMSTEGTYTGLAEKVLKPKKSKKNKLSVVDG